MSSLLSANIVATSMRSYDVLAINFYLKDVVFEVCEKFFIRNCSRYLNEDLIDDNDDN